MILVYSNTVSHRLNYTLNVIFKYVLGVDYTLTSDKDFFASASGFRLNYSNQNFENTVNILSTSLLFEKGIKHVDIDVIWENEIPFFFKTGNDSYDVLASSFWMLTRYEEYLPFKADEHQRFSAKNSLAFQQGFLKLPVVNMWVSYLEEMFKNEYAEIQFPNRKTNFINSLDIDIAFAYRYKGLFRFLGGYAKAILAKDKEELSLRKTYLKCKQDPFDTYENISQWAAHIKTVYFFLLGDKSVHDHNINPRKRGFKRKIKSLAKEHLVGVHPSYQSNSDKKQLEKEIQRLKKIIDKPIEISRQHYLKLTFPFTYEGLIDQGVCQDYTMGYADEIGFRAGICNVYPFYNLELEQERSLWIVPFQVMDGTLNQYMRLTPEQSISEIEGLIEQVRKVDGLFVSLWHNSSLSNSSIWKGWRKVYQEMLNLMKQ